MRNLQTKLWLKLDGAVLLMALATALCGRWLGVAVQVSNVMFLVGLLLICLMIINILLHASLLAGWFKKKQAGESDEEYQARKIDVKSVASKKNKPIHFQSFAANCLVIGLGLIILAIVITI